MMTGTPIHEALALAAAGVRVFPVHAARGAGCSCGCADPDCRTRGKHPRIAKWQDEATTDPARIRAWWQQWPDANVGGAMAPSRLIAIDIDPRNGGDETFADLLRAADVGLPDTWTNHTGGGGLHYIFAAPDGFTCRTDSLGPGVDVKWHGYVLLPPSNHASGRAYEWEIGLGPMGLPAAALPDWLVQRLTARPAADDLPPRDREPAETLLTRPCPEGGRHNTLVRLVGWARNVMGLDAALAVLGTWNRAYCEPPLDDDDIAWQVRDMWKRFAEPARVIWEEEEGEGAAGGEGGAKPPPRARPEWKLISGHELRHLELPPVAWLWERRIPAGRYVVLSGESGLGKSWFALTLALSAGNGEPFLDGATAGGRALYIDEENGIQEAQRRARALVAGLDWPDDADDPIDFLVDEGVKLDQPLHVEQLIALVKERGHTLIITDSLIRFFDGNENHSDEVSRFHAAIDRVRHATGVTWVMLQHLNKAGRDGGAISAGDRLRGSGEFKAHADVHIQLRSVDGGSTITVHVEKLRGGIRPEDIVYRMEGVTALEEPVRLVLLGDTAAAHGAERAALTYAIDLLENVGKLTVGELIQFMRERYGVPKRTAERGLKLGRESGVFVEQREGKNVYLTIREDVTR